MQSSSERGNTQQYGRSGIELPIVVALGVSADRLDGLERFFSAVPRDSDIAFVVLHDGRLSAQALATRLQASCPLPVVTVEDGGTLLAGCIHLPPGDRYLKLDDDRLQLGDAPPASVAGTPIDHFMRCLAERRGTHSIGVLLSDTADGGLGIRAIREAAGLTLAEPPTAAGVADDRCAALQADLVAAAEQLPAKIAAHRRAWGRVDAANIGGAGGAAAFEQILLLLRAHTGHDFSAYKKTSLARRIERRISLHGLDRHADYVEYLRENPPELSLLFKELLIGVTRFFREPASWHALQQLVLPGLLDPASADRPYRAWVAGCSTGEEAYTLAIVLHEAISRRQDRPHRSLQVFATDLDPDAIDRARAGLFEAGIADDIGPERLQRYFVPERDGYRVVREIREMVVFAPHNVFMDPPFTRLELVVCRNLLIYMEPALQRKLFALFHFCLNPGGVLFLGSAETVGRESALFDTVDNKARLYRRAASGERNAELEFPSRLLRHRVGAGSTAPPAANLQQLAEQLLLQRFCPAAVLVNGHGDILYINGRTGRYLEPAAGRANWNIYAMARRGIGQELAIALPRALREKIRVDCPAVEVSGDPEPYRVDVSVVGIDEPEPMTGLAMVLFSEAHRTAAAVAEVDPTATAGELQRQLQLAREAVRSTRDEMRSQQEELRSANEELQSTNEELQSANEELTTSKEEMQSLNEELQAVNHELQGKLDELSLARSDVDNLLNVTDLAVVFLDAALRVRRYSESATQVFKLVPADAGRCLTHIASDLDYPELPQDVDEVLRTLAFCDRQVVGKHGRRYRVRIRPYRTLGQRIDGVVLSVAELPDGPGGAA